MKNELISFETAKLAKEKGFNNAVDWGWYYDSRDSNLTWLDLGSYLNQKDFLYQATTQALLQRYLREVHGVNVWARPVYDQDFGRIIYLIAYLTSEDFIERESFAFYESSEEALEKGLLEELKLI